MDPATKEAKSVAQSIMIEVRKIIIVTMREHKLWLNLPWDMCVEVGMEACFKACLKWDMNSINKRGYRTTLNAYMRGTAYKSIYYAGLTYYKAGKKSINMDLQEAEQLGYLPPLIEEEEPTIDIRAKYEFIFKDDQHMALAFSNLCDALENGITGKRKLMQSLTSHPELYTKTNGTIVQDPSYVGKLINRIYRIIKDYNDDGTIPELHRKYKGWNYKEPKIIKKVINTRTKEVWESMRIAVLYNNIDDFAFLQEVQPLV
jgi:hypothetical protein